MKTEAELLEAQKQKEQVVDPTPDILFGVVYTQDSLQTSQTKAICGRFTNVEAFADADFDMDLDCNFHESESLFFGSLLGFTKKEEDDEDDSSDEEKKTKTEAAAASQQEETKEEEQKGEE